MSEKCYYKVYCTDWRKGYRNKYVNVYIFDTQQEAIRCKLAVEKGGNTAKIEEICENKS